MKLLTGLLDDGVTATDRRRILRGTMHSFLIQGVSIVLVFASNWWLVRSTDTASYGLYVHVFNWVSILAILVIGGRDDLVLAQLPKYIAAGQGARVLRLVKGTNGWILLSTLVVCGGFIALISLLPLRSLSEHRSLFLIAVAAVYFSAALSLNQMILQALNHIRQSQLVEKIARPLLLIVFTGLFRLSVTRFDSRTLVLIATAVSALCCFVILWLVYRTMRRFDADAAAAAPAESHGRKTAWFFSISLLNLLSTKVTMLMLPLFVAAESAIGIFNIAYRFADLLILPFFLMHVVLPQLFARHSIEEKEYTRSLFNESTRLMTVLSIPLLLVNMLAGPFLLRFFGHDFGTGYNALVYISLAQLLFSLFGPANTILMMQGREKYSAYCLMVYVAALIVTSRLLIPGGGITGGALAILISSAVYNGLLAVLLYRFYGICTPFLSFLVKPR
ncbi:polysaccharide biosynthesis C-terminal domain-containing protein [Puia dinghuensis]|uniref:Polysaccharide biosynthesis-like protein n=1 Tax=Puia dinghuensis TaxID=1792502 RepID=A0A8J2U8P1_9BACT|nr:polysaccharide biosynthesis C-terminal domain-containing protein [Puia dinghuensis]GGA85994.1 polysaccharide biosynthesis-like protein [Puia dinghuensis]